MVTVEWCIGKKKGISLVEPNENLCKGYFLKAEESLLSMRNNKGNKDWEISSGYYAMYFSLYALLMKIGVKCEIHSCSIEFMRRFLKGYFIKEDIDLIESSLSARIDAQYYTDRNVKDEAYNKIIDSAADFMVKCKTVSSSLTEKDILKIRDEFNKVKKKVS